MDFVTFETYERYTKKLRDTGVCSTIVSYLAQCTVMNVELVDPEHIL